MNRIPVLVVLLLAASAARADKLVLVAGGGDGPDGSPATTAKLIQPFGVDFGPDGTTYIVEMAKGERLRAVNAKGELVSLAGTGRRGYSGDGGPAREATFNGMHSLAVGPDGNVYLADTWNNCVRVFDPKAGSVNLFAGKPVPLPPDVRQPPPNADLGGVYSICWDPAGTALYVCDLDRRRILKADRQTRALTAVAGNGQKGVPKDGEDAASQPLVDPRAVAVDAKGNVYILERGGHALRVVDERGKIRTVAGTGKAGQGTGQALEAAMNGPKHLCVDRDGSVLIADTENHRIVRYVPGAETLVLVAGTGKRGTAGVGGDPRKAEFNQPHGIAVHPKTGEVYISDASNGRVLKIVKDERRD
jgi:DNA-binding beta-propeller fold protein YncE